MTLQATPLRSGRPARRPAARPQTSQSAGGGSVILPDNTKVSLDAFLTSYSNPGFTGANRLGTNRSYIVFPTLDTKREISTFSRTEMLRRARWLYNNVGIAKRIVRSLSRMMGSLQPVPNSEDPVWNREALSIWNGIAGSRLLFERSGKFDFSSYQRFISRRWLIDGDHLSVFARAKEGNAMVAGYEAHQIGNNGPNHDPAWTDGVLEDAGNRARKYRVIHPDRQGHTDFSAAEAILTADWERGGQSRGVTPFHAAILRMIDVRDLTGDMMDAIKKSNLVGIYLANPDPGNQLLGADLIAGTKAARKMYDEDGEETEDDLEAVMKLDIEELMDRGGFLPDMGGKEPRLLHDGRPHPHQMSLVSWFIRELCVSFDVAPEIVWEIASLNGNTSRLLNEDTESVLADLRSVILKPFCQRAWFGVMGTEINSGRFREPSDGSRWDDVTWLPPKAKTIDRGRDGMLNLEQLRMPGVRTLEEHHGEVQRDWSAESHQWWAEKKKLLDDGIAAGFEREVVLGVVLPGIPGAAPGPAGGMNEDLGEDQEIGENPADLPEEPDAEPPADEPTEASGYGQFLTSP